MKIETREVCFPEHAPSRGGALPPDPGSRLVGCKLLVAEDNPVSQLVISKFLAAEGGDFILVSNGRDAVESIRDDVSSRFRAVLMDIMMPDMGGHEAAARIREMRPDLPIIALTAQSFEQDRDRCLAAGMVGCITKPFNRETVVHTVLLALGHPVRPSAPLPVGISLPAAEAQQGEGPDWGALLATYGKRPDMVESMLKAFLESSVSLPGELRVAVAAGDSARIAALAHSLSGGLCFIKAEIVLNLARTTERTARRGHPATPEQAKHLADCLEVLLAAIRARLPALPASGDAHSELKRY